MDLAPKQQTVELIKKSNNILITAHKNPDGDALGATLALGMALIKLNKTVTIASSGAIAKIYNFLPKIDLIKHQIATNKDFIIELDLSSAQIDKLGYKKLEADKKLNIVITPKEGTFTAEDVNFIEGQNIYDLIFVLDTAELSLLGELFETNTEIFYDVPTINIDHHPGNEYFGKINWVDITATSTAEIVVSLIESLGREINLLDSDIATCLLAGITTDTGSFQNTNTTPKSLTIAAQLVAAGGRQQEIIKNIYKTKPLTTLKVWGEIFQNIHEESQEHFIWSEIDSKTLTSLGAEETEIGGVLDELKSAQNNDFVVLLSERDGGIHASLRATAKGIDVASIAQEFGGGGHEAAAAFEVPDATLKIQRDEIISKIKQIYQKNLKR